MIIVQEKDYKTAYSYFYEAYENYEAMPSKDNKVQAKQCLKYMLLTKIMAGSVLLLSFKWKS